MDFRSLINNKTVVVLGSAAYLEDYRYGKSIDEHDLVVRINRGCELIENNSEVVGSRTDILYSCLIEQKQNAGKWNREMFAQDYGLKFLCTPPESNIRGISFGTRLHNMVDRNKYLKLAEELPCRIIDSSFFTSLAREIDCRPTTGYIAIYDLLKFEPKSLTIHGFDFFYSGWYSDYKKGMKPRVSDELRKTLNSKRHKHKNMWEHCKKLLDNPTVVIDDHLRKVLRIDEWWYDERV